ncbi:MAG: methylated-DNA--[protein]-cysteine S-methyltransferase [Pseudomonadales bacterium]|nr:methylated-DNA--[protein]-cysteine S-methyltransferase [Pseudomonadales bacterium]
MVDELEINSDYILIEKAIHFIEDNALEHPSLAEIADYTGMTEHHFQKVFSRWAGISPKRFLQFLTKESIKQQLHQSSIEQAALNSGLSTKSRAYDLLVNCEAMTPGEYKAKGKDLLIKFGFYQTPFGLCLIATTDRGICKLAFCDPSEKDVMRDELKTEWQLASIQEDNQSNAHYVQSIFSLAENKRPLHLLLKGTNFQLKVWEALLNLESGNLTTYHEIAQQIDNPKGVRAVGSAIGKNPIAFIIPCHRVIRKTGEINQYRWGTTRKQAIIAWEQGNKIRA